MENNSNILEKITFNLCDLNPILVDEWKFYFNEVSNFKFYNCDILEIDSQESVAYISPANSFGDMQCGINLVYLNKFGNQLEEDLQKKIITDRSGELLIGEAIIASINNSSKYLISAPTMRVPMSIQYTVNAYLAFRAVLIELVKFNQANPNKEIKTVICPGLGTGIGQLKPNICAKQMWCAYNSIIHLSNKLDLEILSWEHCDMIDSS